MTSTLSNGLFAVLNRHGLQGVIDISDHFLHFELLSSLDFRGQLQVILVIFIPYLLFVDP